MQCTLPRRTIHLRANTVRQNAVTRKRAQIQCHDPDFEEFFSVSEHELLDEI